MEFSFDAILNLEDPQMREAALALDGSTLVDQSKIYDKCFICPVLNILFLKRHLKSLLLSKIAFGSLLMLKLHL